MPNITTRKQSVVQLSNCNGQLQDETCNEVKLDWPICALYNLLEMHCNQQTDQNLLGIYYKTAILPLTAFLAPGFFIPLEAACVYVA